MTRQQRNKRIVALIQKGETYDAVGQAFGVTRQRVHQIVCANGVRSARDYKTWTEREDDLLFVRYGFRYGEASKIAKELGRTKNEVVGRANRLGLSNRPRFGKAA